MKEVQTLALILCLLQISQGINIRGKSFAQKLMSSNDISIEITTLNSKYESVLQIPSGRNKYYQIDAGTSGKYKVTSGSSVYVNNYGTISPRNVTWYWYGGKGYSVPQEGKTPDRIEKKFYPGISVVTATVGDSSFKITVTVKEYSEEYVENILDTYVKTNVTDKNTLEKFRAITAFPAQYPYNGSYYQYIDMVIFKGGDCWASSSLIQHLCEKVGIKSHIRFAARDPLSGSGHRNVAALIDKKIYIGEAGYGYYTPNRPWKVEQQNVGYFYKTSGNGIIIYQYDGYEEEINVPSTIDNKTVVGFIYDCFRIGESYSNIKIRKITLPKTIISIDEYTFSDLKYLKEINIPFNVTSRINTTYFKGCDSLISINVDKDNSEYSSIKGVLFNKNQTKLIIFPLNKNENFSSPSSLETIEEYAFNNIKNTISIKFGKKVKYIGQYAFSNSTIKEIFFSGEKPQFGENALLNMNISIFYPLNSNTWKPSNFGNFGSKSINFFTWNPNEDKEKEEEGETNENKNFFEKYKTPLIILIVIIIMLIIGITSIIIIRKRRSKSYNTYIDSIQGGLISGNMANMN